MPESEFDRLGPRVTLIEKDGRFYLFDTDLAVIGSLTVEDFNGDAAVAVRWTQAVLADASRRFLEPLVPAAHGIGDLRRPNRVTARDLQRQRRQTSIPSARVLVRAVVVTGTVSAG